jgi:hypothetical protein
MSPLQLERAIAGVPAATSLVNEANPLETEKEREDIEAPRSESPASLASAGIEQGIGVTKIEALCEWSGNHSNVMLTLKTWSLAGDGSCGHCGCKLNRTAYTVQY